MAQFTTRPISKPAACFEAGQEALKQVDPISDRKNLAAGFKVGQAAWKLAASLFQS